MITKLNEFKDASQPYDGISLSSELKKSLDATGGITSFLDEIRVLDENTRLRVLKYWDEYYADKVQDRDPIVTAPGSVDPFFTFLIGLGVTTPASADMYPVQRRQ